MSCWPAVETPHLHWPRCFNVGMHWPHSAHRRNTATRQRRARARDGRVLTQRRAMDGDFVGRRRRRTGARARVVLAGLGARESGSIRVREGQGSSPAPPAGCRPSRRTVDEIFLLARRRLHHQTLHVSRRLDYCDTLRGPAQLQHPVQPTTPECAAAEASTGARRAAHSRCSRQPEFHLE